jgi:single-stranded DNA-binding protein
MQNNKAHLVGTICSPFEYSHTVRGEDFYKANISILRNSGIPDVLPVMVSSRIVDVKNDMSDYRIEILGSLRSYNQKNEQGNRSRLMEYIWADVFQETDSYDYNIIEFDGYLCKTPIYRTTPLGREITDLLIAVNRPYGKSDYIPTVAWGRNAQYLSNFRTGDHVVLKGRIQSRNYMKVCNGVAEEKTTYEVSVLTLFDGSNDYERKEADQSDEVLQ